MSISDWFKAREGRRYTPATGTGSADVPEGVWVKCEGCKRALYEGELAEDSRVCRHCGYHFDLTAPERISLLVDPGEFEELDVSITSTDPLGFCAAKPYAESLISAREKSGLSEAIVTGRGRIGGHDVILGAMDFRFVGASMGSVVGEKVARAFEHAIVERVPVVLAISSGGARMQEGMLSLLQMAKTAAVARRHSEAGLPFVSILANPTFGGVTASFAVLADVVVSEPGALVGFAGPRLVEQTTRQKPPKEFQTAESLLAHGMIDEIVPRAGMKAHVSLLLDYLVPRGGATS